VKGPNSIRAPFSLYFTAGPPASSADYRGPALPITSIHPIAWKGNSANFAYRGFSETGLPV